MVILITTAIPKSADTKRGIGRRKWRQIDRIIGNVPDARAKPDLKIPTPQYQCDRVFGATQPILLKNKDSV